jgi:Aldehyde:ferredoxin oxidoreductase
MDTISLGKRAGYVMEASERGYGEKLGFVVEWGDYEAAKQLAYDIAYRRGVGDLLAEGVRRIAERIGGEEFAIHTKGLEVSATTATRRPPWRWHTPHRHRRASQRRVGHLLGGPHRPLRLHEGEGGQGC